MRNDLLIHQLAALAGQRTRDGLEACLLELFNELLQPRDVAIYRLNSAGGRQRWSVRRRVTSSQTASQMQALQQPAAGWVQQHAACWASGKTQSDAASPAVTLVPMTCQDDTHCLVEITSPVPLSPEQMGVIEGILQGLINENERDALTRLLNRKSFDESFFEMAVAPLMAPAESSDTEPPESRRKLSAEPQHCWLAMIDIDHFKRVNDTFGHLIGDEVLILVARLLRENFRAGDRLYRFGGEEFVVMLNTPRSELAAKALERLRQKIENYSFPRVGRLTISIGYTEVKVTDNPSSAFERADECVYHAKSNGRNQIVAYDSLLQSHVVETPQPDSEVEFF
jgi:diguanylate cyclase (GGDEF)-like protein